jgi:ATP-dependent helicase Lhr and Lhr-like helicase
MLLVEKADGPRLLLLAGRSWRVTWIDWKRRRCYVELADGGGKSAGPPTRPAAPASPSPAPHATCCSAPTRPVAMTQRAIKALGQVRDEQLCAVHPAEP